MIREVAVRLLKPHTHAGQPYAADAIINVSAHTAAWLVDRSIASIEKPAFKPFATTKPRRGDTTEEDNHGS